MMCMRKSPAVSEMDPPATRRVFSTLSRQAREIAPSESESHGDARAASQTTRDATSSARDCLTERVLGELAAMDLAPLQVSSIETRNPIGSMMVRRATYPCSRCVVGMRCCSCSQGLRRPRRIRRRSSLLRRGILLGPPSEAGAEEADDA